MNKGNTNSWYLDNQPGVIRRIPVLYQGGGFRCVGDSSGLLQTPDFLLGYYNQQPFFGDITPTSLSSGLLHPPDFLLGYYTR
jgi:hypothetical protein